MMGFGCLVIQRLFTEWGYSVAKGEQNKES